MKHLTFGVDGVIGPGKSYHFHVLIFQVRTIPMELLLHQGSMLVIGPCFLCARPGLS